MNVLDCWYKRQIAGCLVVLLAVPFGGAAAMRQQSVIPGQQTDSTSSASTSSQMAEDVINHRSTVTDQSGGQAASTAGKTSDAELTQQTVTAPASPTQEQNNSTEPVGTAAAPYEKTTGVSASRPAGVVIAPAKQKRARSILIKLGVILGAAAAIGIVAGLSSASPSRPH